MWKLDHIKSSDLNRWLKYVGWTEEKFDLVCNTYRNPRVWWIENGKWAKYDINGKKNSSAMSKINKVYDIKKIDDYGSFSKIIHGRYLQIFHRFVSKVIKRILPIIENSDTTLSESLKVFVNGFYLKLSDGSMQHHF